MTNVEEGGREVLPDCGDDRVTTPNKDAQWLCVTIAFREEDHASVTSWIHGVGFRVLPFHPLRTAHRFYLHLVGVMEGYPQARRPDLAAYCELSAHTWPEGVFYSVQFRAPDCRVFDSTVVVFSNAANFPEMAKEFNLFLTPAQASR